MATNSLIFYDSVDNIVVSECEPLGTFRSWPGGICEGEAATVRLPPSGGLLFFLGIFDLGLGFEAVDIGADLALDQELFELVLDLVHARRLGSALVLFQDDVPAELGLYRFLGVLALFQFGDSDAIREHSRNIG